MRVKNDFFPLSLGYLGAVLRDANHQVRIYNADIGPDTPTFERPWLDAQRTSGQERYLQALADRAHPVWDEIRSVMKQQTPDMVGISIQSPALPSAKIVAHLAKEELPDCVVVAGGPHPNACPEEVMDDKNIDFVVRGEGEVTIVELVDALEDARSLSTIEGICLRKGRRVIVNPLRPYIKDLDSLPFPAKDLRLFPDLYSDTHMGTIIGSRGCPYQCTFCDSRGLWGTKVRFRSVDNIISEIRQLGRDFGCRRFHFVDDTLTLKRSRLLHFCKAVRATGLGFEWLCSSRADAIDATSARMLHLSGCTAVLIGAESGSERMLRIMKKQVDIDKVRKAIALVRREGMQVITTFLVGTPDETEEDIRKTIRLVRELKHDLVYVNTYVPYPGSEMHEQVKRLGLIGDRPDWSKLSHASSRSWFAVNIPPERFRSLQQELFKAAYERNTRLSLFNVRRWLKESMHLLRTNPVKLLRRIVDTMALRLRLLYSRFVYGL
ncbi:MAG: radical SAM protein [Planctomycetes bacterium]|nr:radical SAM protein [Planctomycetota bacterium]